MKPHLTQIRKGLPSGNLIALAMLLLCGHLQAQLSNPLNTDPSVWNSREVMVIWGQDDNISENLELRQAIFGIDYVAYLDNLNAPFEEKVPTQTVPNSVVNPGVRPMAVQSGDYTGSGEDNLLYAVGVGGGIRISVPVLSSEQNPVDSMFVLGMTVPETSLLINTGVFSSFTAGRGLPHLISGDFDGDGQDEFALAARKQAGNIILQLIDMDGSNTPNLRAVNENETTILDPWGYEVMGICAGDFNGNGKDEIAMVCLRPASSGSSNFSVFLRIYEVSGAGSTTLTEKAGLEIDNAFIQPFLGGDNNLATIKVSVSAMRNNNNTEDTVDKLLVGIAFGPGNNNENQQNYRMQLLSVNPDLNGVEVLSTVTGNTNLESRNSFEIKTGDMNGNRRSDAVLLVGNDFRVYSAWNNILEFEAASPQVQYQGDGDDYQHRNFDVADLDKNGRANIIHAFTNYNSPTNGVRKLSLRSIEFTNQYQPGQVVEKEIFSAAGYGNSQMYFGITAGNFDGDDLILGEPTFYECTYKRPVFILGAPPTHFDHLDGVNFDESNCYLGNSCLFSASYTTQTSESVTAGFGETSDWNVSATASVGADGFGFGVKASLTAKYGEQFEKIATTSVDTSITVQTTTTRDDLIRGMRYPVHVYEYPVYNAAGTLINYVSAAFPQYQDRENYAEQGKLDANYIPYYEAGNLLSYPDIGTFSDFEDIADNLIVSPNQSYTMSNSPGSQTTVTISTSDIFGNETTIGTTAGVSASLGVSGYGLGFETSGEYNASENRINKTSLSGQTEIQIKIDNINGPSGFYGYEVKPYLFWSRDGAGMLAYQVRLSSSQSAPTFWDLNYGTKPDPALMMPYRNEIHYTTGANPNSPIFSRSKSMTFNRLYPNVGEPVVVQCRVHNYSLMATNGPVEVSFYNGNPAAGGQIIADINGQTVFQTSGSIPARGMEVVEMEFAMQLPVTGESFLRFYSVLDPNGNINEIHEDNNIGWQVIGYDCENTTVTNTSDAVAVNERYTQMWAWPNPATDQINLAFNLMQSRAGFVRIIDLQGKIVMEHHLGQLGSGEQEVRLPLPGLPSGMYLVQLNAGETVLTKKVVVGW